MLYTVNNSPYTPNTLESLLGVAAPESPILLYEDGVYWAADGANSAPAIRAATADHPIYALDADLEARGVARVVDGVQVIGFDGFVELVEQHDVAPWL